MNYDEYGDPISSCHKRRLAKVTLYLEVPAVNPETETWYTEDELCKQIENNLPEGFETTSWSDINISDIEGDDQSKFKNPVGFLAPDGKFFLIETEENGLAHLALARRVHDLYEPTITERIYGTSYEQWLENSNLTVALLVKDAMTTLNALYRILENSSLHIRIFKAIERITRAMTTSKIEYH